MRTVSVWVCVAFVITLPAQGIKESKLDYGLALKFESGEAAQRVTPVPDLVKILDWRHDAPASKPLPWIKPEGEATAFHSIAHRASPGRDKVRDLLLADSVYAPSEKAADRRATLLCLGRFFGANTLHAWSYREFAGAAPEGKGEAPPIFSFSELVDTSVGQGPAPLRDKGPKHVARWVRVMTLWPRKAELHLMGEVQQVLPASPAPGDAAVTKNRIRRRQVHLRFLYSDGALTLESLGEGAKDLGGLALAGVPRMRQGGFELVERVVDAGRGEILVTDPTPRRFGHALFATGSGVTRPALVATNGDWKKWMLRGRGRRHPLVAEERLKTGPEVMRMGSWLFVKGKGKKADVVFRCPLGIEVSLREDGIINGLPATRRLLMELVQSVFPSTPIVERYPVPLLPEKTR